MSRNHNTALPQYFNLEIVMKKGETYQELRIDNSRYGPFCCGCSLLRVVISPLKSLIHNIYHIKAVFQA